MKAMVVTMILMLGAPTVAFAQPGEQGPQFGKRIKERMSRLRDEILRYEVGLDEAQALKVTKILKTLDPAREALHKRKRSAKQAMRRLLKTDSNDQAAFQRAIDDLIAVNGAMLELRRKQMKALAGELTPKQQAKLFVAMKRVQKRMRHKMRRFKNRRGQGGHMGRPGRRHDRGGGGGHFGPPSRGPNRDYRGEGGDVHQRLGPPSDEEPEADFDFL